MNELYIISHRWRCTNIYAGNYKSDLSRLFSSTNFERSFQIIVDSDRFYNHRHICLIYISNNTMHTIVLSLYCILVCAASLYIYGFVEWHDIAGAKSHYHNASEIKFKKHACGEPSWRLMSRSHRKLINWSWNCMLRNNIRLNEFPTPTKPDDPRPWMDRSMIETAGGRIVTFTRDSSDNLLHACTRTRPRSLNASEQNEARCFARWKAKGEIRM